MYMYVHDPEPELEPEPEPEPYSDNMSEPERSSNFPVPQPWYGPLIFLSFCHWLLVYMEVYLFYLLCSFDISTQRDQQLTFPEWPLVSWLCWESTMRRSHRWGSQRPPVISAALTRTWTQTRTNTRHGHRAHEEVCTVGELRVSQQRRNFRVIPTLRI